MIIRVARRELPFVQVDKSAIDDDSLSWRAKGLLVYLISKPDSWNCNLKQLTSASTEGRDATRKALNELQEAGYAVKRAKRKTDGSYSGWDWTIYEQPQGVDSARTTINADILGGPVLDMGPGEVPEDEQVLVAQVAPENSFSLKEYIDVWREHYKGDFFPARHAKKFKEHEAVHGADLLTAFKSYCSATEEQWASPMSFIGKIGAYLPQKEQDLDAFMVQ